MNYNKNWIVSIFFLIGSYIATSQNLKPILHKIDTTTYFCFSSHQARFIAQNLETRLHQGRIIDSLEKQRNRRISLVTKQKTLIHSLNTKVENLTFISRNEQKQITALEQKVINQNKQIRKHKQKHWLIGSGGLLLIITTILINN